MLPDYNEVKRIFNKNEFELTEEQYKKFNVYAENLIEWNNKINLTAITDSYGITVKHLLDSVFPLKLFKIKEKAKIIDVGTGAGFPGIPVKIMRNDINLTLLDSLNKRVNFLKDTSDKLGIQADCIHCRAEDAGRNSELREKFDVACARAVANLPVLCEYCMPFVKTGGYFIALKGPNEDIGAAKKAVSVLGGEIENVIDYTVEDAGERKLIIIKKISAVPKIYPRNSGQISKKPL